jgi:hypoxanthine phosphoribosyltransferase
MHNPSHLLEQSELIHSAQQVQAAISRLGQEIASVLADEKPVVICVMGGGVVFAGQLLTELHFPLELDYVHASRYQNTTVGKTLHWQSMPKLDLSNRTVLLIDDILDQGITLKEIQNKCVELGANKVYCAVLVEKTLSYEKPIKADFIGLTVPDRYVFGYGMDAYGWWRNLSAIHALKA